MCSLCKGTAHVIRKPSLLNLFCIAYRQEEQDRRKDILAAITIQTWFRGLRVRAYVRWAACMAPFPSAPVCGCCCPRQRIDRVLHWVHLSVFVCLSALNFSVFLRNCLSHWDKIFTMGATTHVECFSDNYDVIGHLLSQPCWKNGKTLHLCISETTPRKKLKLCTWQVLLKEE